MPVKNKKRPLSEMFGVAGDAKPFRREEKDRKFKIPGKNKE